MAVTDLPWPVVAGDDEALVIVFEDLPYVAGRTWRAQVRRQRKVDGDLLAEATVYASEGDDGMQVVTCSLSAEQTRAISVAPAGWWDLQVTEAGKTSTPFGGRVPITSDITEGGA